MTRNVLKPLGFVRVAFAVAVGIPLLLVSSALAQAPAASPAADANAAPTGGTAEVERVVVTGSNIPTAEEVGPNPVDTYRKDDLTRLGVRTASDLIHSLPAASGSQINENNTNGGDGRAEINLRGIFAKETLVLQDGRRLAPVGFAGATVDLNTFPVGLIDHVDILKDGSSAVYGSDAVAGVFNVWLTHKFRGLEIYASYGNTNLGFAGDRGEERAYILAGTGDDKTEIVVYAEFYNAAAIFSRDADISHNPQDFPNFGGSDSRSGNYAGRIRGFAFYRSLNPTGARTPTIIPGTTPATHPEYRSIFFRGPHHAFFNFLALTPAIAATDREYFYGSVERKICDEYLVAFADFKYARTFWDGGLAPAPFTPDIWVDSTHATGISAAGFSVPTQNAFNPFGATGTNYVSPGGVPPGRADLLASAAPPGTAFITGVRYRSLEAGLRTDKITTNNYLFTGGLKGNLGEFGDYLKTWNWETGFRYNEDYRVERFGGITNNNALRTALLDTNPATAFNPFGLNTNNRAVRDRVFVTTNHIGATQMELEDLKLNGDLFNLPAGPLSFAIGGEHRREHANDNPDALTASGQTTGATNFQPTKGSRDVWSTYWEVRLPVTSPAWNFPGLYSLEFNYQERYDNFSDFGSTERPKFSVRWQPLDSAWTVRATYSEAFHAPTLGELFSGQFQSFPTVTDPQSNPSSNSTAFTGTEKQVEQIGGGNPNLQPEIAYEWTYGTVVTPGKWWSPLTGLTLSADFYHIDLRSISLTLAPQDVINSPQFQNLVTRAPPGTNGGNNPFFGPIVSVNTPILNLGRFIEEGWDYEAVYTFETNRLGHGDWGTFTATLNGTYLDRAIVQLLPGGPETSTVGKFGGGFIGATGGGNFTHNRFYSSMFYDGPQGSWLGGFDTGMTVHFVGQYWDDKGFTFDGQSRKVREWITADFLLNYTFNIPAPAATSEVAGLAKDGGKNVQSKDGKDKNVMPVSTAEYNPCGWRAWLNNTTLTLGINNITDEQPPFVAGAFENGYDEQTANLKGRQWYVAIKHRF